MSSPEGSGLDHLWAGWRTEYITAATDEARAADQASAQSEERCVFCRILASGRPDQETFVVHRSADGLVVALLNAYPYATGHVLVMPVRHTGDLEALDGAESSTLWATATAAAGALRRAYRPDGLNLGANLGAAAGAGIPGHLHLHVLPRWAADSNFMTAVANTRVLPEALDATAAKLREAWPV